jgi:G3E family GTPase
MGMVSIGWLDIGGVTMERNHTAALPIYILSGFLGSGKTTLLQRVVDTALAQGKRPAVVMNELGDVNLDGVVIDGKVPMAEMLSGCICCTIKDDLSLSIKELAETQQPDFILIESTGIANPMEILDAITEASLFMPIELQEIVTVVDARHLFELSRGSRGKTLRLMEDQVRCASKLLVNKMDLVSDYELNEVHQIVRAWNAFAPILNTVQCEIDLSEVFGGTAYKSAIADKSTENACSPADDLHDGHHHDHYHDQPNHHHSHDHVMVYTHYLDRSIDSERFELFMKSLPTSVYRGKGILTFSDTASRYLLQYAYRETDFTKMPPNIEVPDVLVFIGEHFSKSELIAALEQL